MKTKLSFTLLLFFVSLHLLAQQNPFIGGGTYSVQAGKVTAKNQIGTVPYDVNSKEKVELTYKIEGDKVYQKGVHTEADGSSHTFSDVFEKVRSKTAKTASNR
jgi:hypothetical protein